MLFKDLTKNEINSSLTYEQYLLLVKNFYNLEKINNPELDKLRGLLEEAFNVNIFYNAPKDNLDGIKEKIKKLSISYQNILFYRTWERKGKIIGIHSEFGKLSFINSDAIPNNYHCNQEDIVEIILDIIGMLEAFDSI
jgi:hypothetical protein